jgi:outer membrane immunogenic protein
MNRFSAASISLALLAASATATATAADLRLKAPRGVPPPAFTWTGCYFGGYVGGLVGQTRWRDPLGNFDIFINNQDVDHASFTGGGQIGCNYQINQFVIGIEADIGGAHVDKVSLNEVVEARHTMRTVR